MRRTKIVATIGPATTSEKTLLSLLRLGVNVFRFNLKYSPTEWHNQKIGLIRALSKKVKINVAIMIDIPSADFRIEIRDFDYVALSYLKTSKEVENLKGRLQKNKISAKVVAKIENGMAIKNLIPIINSADGIMVARGDLGREIPIEELAFFQKKIVDECRRGGKPVIVATEMLYSMINNPNPTRAEATDVANAVFDGTDAVMLSEETAVGKYPIEAVSIMGKILSFCENTGELRNVEIVAKTLTDAIAESAAKMTRDKLDKPIKAVVTFTRGGTTTRIMSRYRLAVPLIAICNDTQVLNQLCLSYGAIPYYKTFKNEVYTGEDPVFEELKNSNWLKKGDTIVIVHGDSWFGLGPANRLSVRTI